MLHIAFQEQGIMPDELYAKPRAVKNFVYASTILKLEAEEKASKKK